MIASLHPPAHALELLEPVAESHGAPSPHSGSAMSAAFHSPSRRKPSVLHIFKIYYPDLFGGTLTVIHRICADLRESFSFSALVCTALGGARTIDVDGVPVERVRSLGDFLSLPMAPTYPFRLWRRMPRHDLCVMHAPFPLADLVLGFGFGRRQPFVVHWHADITTRSALRPIVQPFIRRTLRRASAIIVADEVLARETPILREFADKCRVVPFGIDVEKYIIPEAERAAIATAKRQNPGVVLACGRLVPYKGFDVLIHAAALGDFTVWIVGAGREQSYLEELAAELGVQDRIRLLGAVSDEHLVRLLHLAEVFVLPSVTDAETFGLAQLEAMAAGCAIVNTALNTAVPMVARHGIEAYTVPPRDPVALADAVTALLGDSETRQRFGEAGQQRAAACFSSQMFKSKIEDIYFESASPVPSRVEEPARAQERGLSIAGMARLAAVLAWSDVRHRYVRSILGPFWMSLQLLVTVGVLGAFTSQMTRTEPFGVLPTLAVSLTVWSFLNGVVLDAMNALPNAANLIKDRAVPPPVFLMQCFFRQALFALHNAIVPLGLWLAFGSLRIDNVVAALPGFLLFCGCALGLALTLGALATRFRDVKPIVESSLMLAFLASPVMWTAASSNPKALVLKLNPVTHLFSVWRQPLLDGTLAPESMALVVGLLAFLVAASGFALRQMRRAAFWI
ncbi:glycosyltransferase [Methylocapsa sp. S129]|uniref:glycosyltransferase n=1 Tax=Methylocapsa sp. S129 TaxID=1641869 RepID=UPI001FEF560E|nr:glycosyltransferase [Methylocapsa sp. S129]